MFHILFNYIPPRILKCTQIDLNTSERDLNVFNLQLGQFYHYHKTWKCYNRKSLQPIPILNSILLITVNVQQLNCR